MTILIPVYQPSHHLLTLVNKLVDYGFRQIIIVNDGSTVPDSQKIFSALSAYQEVVILSHENNQGKGAALRTGFEYYLTHFAKSSRAVITVDADGQHAPDDIVKVSQCFNENPSNLILGVREFHDVPWRSKLGNQFTRWFLAACFHLKLQDTQTGLRAIPNCLVTEFLTIQKDHYEFEACCLMLCLARKVKITEVPIQTIYIDYNASSHFRPLVDSVRIYGVFLRFALSAWCLKKNNKKPN